jgi:predicted CXXCH cytochrome family protein
MKGRSRSFLLALAAILVVAFGFGCDRYARHKVLTFFFTGVPPLEEGKKAPEKEKEPEKKAAEERKEPKRRAVIKATRFSHGPYASGACYLCHETSQTGGFRGLGKKEEAAGSVAKAGVVPGKLVAPLRELCAGCHETKSKERARREGLWVHGPVSAGYCTVCHGPHAGPQPYLLLKKANESCLGCHAEGLIFSKALHEGKKECLSCHNAHFGKNSRLLTAEYRETW